MVDVSLPGGVSTHSGGVDGDRPLTLVMHDWWEACSKYHAAKLLQRGGWKAQKAYDSRARSRGAMAAMAAPHLQEQP